MRADQFEQKERQLRVALAETTQRLGRHFANVAARESAAAYLQSLLSTVERKNSWQLAEVAGFETPYRFQHLLGRGAWDADALRDEQLGEVLAGLGEEDAVLAIDETGFIKQGNKSVGVARQYCGASGKIDNCQVGVFLSWQTSKGHALIDRALYLPREWTEDKARRQAAGVPEQIAFAPKPSLARAMVERVLAAGVRPAWVVADAVYGSDSKLRFALEEAQQPYVMAVTSKQSVCIGLEKKAARTLLARLQPQSWKALSAGAGTKGPRLFDWALLPINQPYDPKRWQRFLLLRRSRSKDEEITFYLAFASAGTTLMELARIAGRRWTIEESFAQAKAEVGLDQYEVRSWTGWYRHMTLAMAAQALLAITRARLFAKPAANTLALAAFKKSRGAFLPPAREGQRGGGTPLFRRPALGS
jgi:SRSO17 transposase